VVEGVKRRGGRNYYLLEGEISNFYSLNRGTITLYFPISIHFHLQPLQFPSFFSSFKLYYSRNNYYHPKQTL
ncbi:hypothetical protein KSS87_020501, partial [Heliosperma pusillum]